jgi:hypothetical protein
MGDLKNLDNMRCTAVNLTIDIVVSLPHNIHEKHNRASWKRFSAAAGLWRTKGLFDENRPGNRWIGDTSPAIYF